MAKGKTKIFHLEMDGKHYYFGSPKAMFDIMGEEKMGMKYSSYHSNIILKVGDEYKNRRHGYIIRLGELGQAKTNRGVGMEVRINNRIKEALMAHGITEEGQQPAEQNAEVTAVETPIEVQPQTAEPQPQTAEAQPQTVEPQPQTAEPTVEVQAPAKKSRKKKGDVPEQLTLF